MQSVRSEMRLSEGKLPNDLLAAFLRELGAGDSRLLIAPGVGQDIAAVELSGEEVLLLKTDPITFATESIAYYSVAVNANDIATAGAQPRWLLATLLFPLGTTAEQVRQTMAELHAAATEFGMQICGGHTEITDAVQRPIISAHAAGTVSRSRLIDKKNMQEGDRLLLTKGIAIEGTSILAREFAALLRERGASEALLGKCRRFLREPGISIVCEARIAADTGAVTAMHDITEGGLATALEELSVAGRHRIRVFRNRIPILEETQKISAMLGIDPLGLIGSGSLLIACTVHAADALLQSIGAAGIRAVCIGEVLEGGTGIEAVSGPGGSAIPWPHFEVDELARVFQEMRSG